MDQVTQGRPEEVTLELRSGEGMRRFQAWRRLGQAGVADAKALRQKQLGLFKKQQEDR